VPNRAKYYSQINAHTIGNFLLKLNVDLFFKRVYTSIHGPQVHEFVDEKVLSEVAIEVSLRPATYSTLQKWPTNSKETTPQDKDISSQM
jgi:hypothetical protein